MQTSMLTIMEKCVSHIRMKFITFTFIYLVEQKTYDIHLAVICEVRELLYLLSYILRVFREFLLEGFDTREMNRFKLKHFISNVYLKKNSSEKICHILIHFLFSSTAPSISTLCSIKLVSSTEQK